MAAVSAAASAYVSATTAWATKVGEASSIAATRKPAVERLSSRPATKRASSAMHSAAETIDTSTSARAGSTPKGASSLAAPPPTIIKSGYPGGCGTPKQLAAAASSPESSKVSPGAAQRRSTSRATTKVSPGVAQRRSARRAITKTSMSLGKRRLSHMGGG